MAKPTKLALIVCTRNRAAQLTVALRSFAALKGNPEDWELVVVDNGSTDQTATVLSDFMRNTPIRATLVHCDKPGKGHALNAGVAATDAGILAFTDDDCYPEPDLLLQMRLLLDTRPDVGLIGGRVLLYDPTDAPMSIRTESAEVLLPPYSFLRPGYIIGANMAVRREIYDAIGGFDPAFGPGTPFSVEDNDFLARVSNAGFAILYNPGPTVLHHHRRKAGEAMRRLFAAYQYGEGAYFAKFILRPQTRSLYGRHFYWSLRSDILHRRFGRIGRMLKAAARYLLLRMMGRLPISPVVPVEGGRSPR